jgi:ribonuclease HI
VAVGHVPGVYQDWSLAAEQIKDFKGPKYRKFGTKAEAEEFVRSGGQIPTFAEPSAKKTKKTQDTAVHIYTDGSSRGNGKKGALAGVGVFFGDGDSR